MLCEQHIWKAKHFLDIFLTDSCQKVLVLPLRGATLAPPTMRELRTSLALSPRSLARIFNDSHALMTGLQHDRDAWTGRWVPCNRTSSVHWQTGLVPAELHVHGEWLKLLTNFRSFRKPTASQGVQTVFFLLLPWLFMIRLREISWWKVVVTALTSWVTSPSGNLKTLRKVWVHPIRRELEPNFKAGRTWPSLKRRPAANENNWESLYAPCFRFGVSPACHANAWILGRTVRSWGCRSRPSGRRTWSLVSVHLPSSIDSLTRLEIVSHPFQALNFHQATWDHCIRKGKRAWALAQASESVTMSSTARIIAATCYVRERAKPCTEARVRKHWTHLPVHASRSCCRPVISAWLSLKLRASDWGDNAREVRSSRIVGGASIGGASVAPQREYQHFLVGVGQENVQKMFSFSDMLFTKHWKQIPKKTVFKNTKTKTKFFFFFFLLKSRLQSHFVAVNCGVFWWWD